MEILGIKRFSYGAAMAFAVILFLIIAGAMFFADEVDDFFDHREPQTIQVMELRGSWLGVKLTGLDSPTAQRLGIPPTAEGVLVVEIAEMNGWRARQAGVVEGDVIVGVDGQTVRDLADLYDISRKVNVGEAVLLDVRRWGQPITLVLPALHTPIPGTVPMQPGQFAQPGQVTPGMTPGVNPAAAQPVAWNRGVGAAYPPVMNVAAGPGAQFYCPTHQRMWGQSAVQPNYVCPLGNCPLSRVR